jgi:hypothetical protein
MVRWFQDATNKGGRWAPSAEDLSGRDACSYGRVLSAVHDEVAACDPAGAIRNQEPDQLRNIQRNTHPPQRNRGSHGLRGNTERLRKVGPDSIRPGRGYVAGSNGVYPHPVRRHFGSERLAPRIHRCLCGRIVNHRATRRSERRSGRNVDD